MQPESGCRRLAWHGRGPDTMTDLYLRDRGIRCAIPAAIRHHPALAYWDGGHCLGSYPALVAAVTELCSGRFLAVHRIYLDASIDAGPARKAVILDGEGRTLRTKKSRGATRGGAVVLGTLQGTGRVYVDEGIATMLSAMSLTGWPGIATLGASNMPEVELPPHVRDVVIVPDPDRPGRRHAFAAAKGWAAEGRRVRIAGGLEAADAA